MKNVRIAIILALVVFITLAGFAQVQGEGERYFKLALNYLQTGEYQKTVDNCTISLRYIPKEDTKNLFNVYQLRGTAKSVLGRHTEAVADFTSALSLNQQVADVYNGRAWSYCFTGDYARAIIDADKAISLNKKAEFYDTRATAHGLRLSFYNSINDFNEAIKLLPKALYYYKRGLVKKANNNIAGADQDFAIAKSLDKAEMYKLEKDPFYSFFTAQYYTSRGSNTNAATEKDRAYIYPVKQDQFSILFPKLPQQTSNATETFSKHFSAACAMDKEMFLFHYYVISYAKYEDLKNSDILKAVREQNGKRLNESISDVQPFVYKSLYSGVAYRLTGAKTYGLLKDILVGNKIYSIGLYNFTRPPTNEEFERFYKGFQTTD